MINVSELLLTIHRVQGTHELDRKVGLYYKHNRFAKKYPEDFGMTPGNFLKAFKNRTLPGLSSFTYSYYSSTPTMPIAPAKVLEECFYAYLYHKNHRAGIIYKCPLTGDATPLIDGNFYSDITLSVSIIKIIEKYYGEGKDEAEYAIIDFLHKIHIEEEHLYYIDLDSPFFIINKGPSFKEIRYDLALRDYIWQEKEENYEYTGIEEK